MAIETIGLRAVVEGARAYIRDVREMRKAEQELARETQNVEKQTQSAFSRERMSGMGREMTKVGGIMSASVTAPIAAIGFTAINSAKDFEAGMNQVAAVSGATGSEVTELSDLAKEMGRTTRFSASEATEGMNFLAMAGFEVDEVLGALPGTLQLATAANIDLGRAADITSNVLTGYGLDVSEISRVNDVFAKSMTSANVTVGMMGESMKFVAPVAASAGVEFEEASAAIALLGDAGIQGSMAGTSLRMSISRLLSPTGAAADIIEDLGIKTTDSRGNLLSLEQIVRQLEESGAGTAEMMQIFGNRAGPAMSALVSQGADALGDMTTELSNSGGTAEELADVQMRGLQGALHELRAAWEAFGIAIAEAGLLDFITNVVRRVSSFISGMAEANPELLKFASILAGVAAAAGPVLVTLGGIALTVGALSPPVLAAVAAVSALAVVMGALTLDAEALPGPLGTIVGFIQTLADSLPAVALGIGAVVTAMAIQRVANFAIAMQGVVTQMITTRGVAGTMRLGFGRAIAGAFTSPLGAIGAFSLAMVGVDSLLRATTGSGVMEHLNRLFTGTDVAAEAAAEGIDQYNDALTRAGDNADPAIVGTREIEGELRSLEKALIDVEDKYGETSLGIMAANDATKEHAGSIAGLIEGMREQGVSAQEITDIVNDLEPSVQDLVKAELDWSEINNELIGEFNTAASEADSLAEVLELAGDESLGVFDSVDVLTTGLASLADKEDEAGEETDELKKQLEDMGLEGEEVDAALGGMTDEVDESGEAAKEALTPMEEYLQEIKDGEESARNLESAIGDLTAVFGEQNPKVIANNAQIALLEIEKAKLESKTGDLTDAEKDQVVAIEDSIEALENENEVFLRTADAYDPLIKRTQDLTGATDDQAFAFSEAMTKYVEDGGQGVGILDDLNEALANTDSSEAVTEISDLKDEMEEALGPEATAAIFEELGPVLADHFRDAEPEVVEAARALGIPIPKTIDEAIEQNMEDIGLGGHMEMMAERNKPAVITAGGDTGDAYVHGVDTGIEEGYGGITLSTQGLIDAMVGEGVTYGSRESPRVGDAVVGGIQGVIDAYNWGQGAMTMVDNMIGSFRTALESSSPSKRTAEEVGKPIVEGIALGMDTNGSLVAEAAGRTVEDLVITLTESMDSVGGIFGDQATGILSDVGAVIETFPIDEPARDSARKLLEGWREEVEAGRSINESQILTMLADLGIIVQTGVTDIADDTRDAFADLSESLGNIGDLIGISRGEGFEGGTDVASDFVDSLDTDRIEDEIRAKFGDLGGSVAIALSDALADPEGRGGESLARYVQELLDKAKEEGVEGIGELGDDLIETLTEALSTGSDETVEEALEILGKITKAIEDESENISTTLGDGFEEGMMTAEEVLGGWHEKLSEALKEGNELTKGNAEEMLENLDDVLEKTDVPSEFRRWAKGLIDDMGEELANGGELVEEDVIRLIERIGAAVDMAEGECTGLCDAADECSCGGGGGDFGSGGGQDPDNTLGRPSGGGLISPAFPSFDVGTWNVPEDMLAQVHAGEMIVPAEAANMFREIMAPMPFDMSAGETRIENNMSPTFVAQGQTEDEMRQSLYNAVDDFLRQRRDGSLRSGAVISSAIG